MRPRRSPERKKADKRLDKALHALKASKSEIGRAHLVYGAMQSTERRRPATFTEAHREALADLKERRERRSQESPDDGDEPSDDPPDRSADRQ